MSNKFEKLLDYLVNEEMDKANELFHEIVVEKSRTIYENLIAEENTDEEIDEAQECSTCHKSPCECDENVDESVEGEQPEDDQVEEHFGDVEEESTFEIGGDSTDDFEDDTVDHKAPGTFGMGGEEDDDMMGGDDDMMGGDDDMMGGDDDMMGGDEDAPVTKGDLEDFKAEILSALGDHPGAEVDMDDDDGFDDSDSDGDDEFDFDDEDEEDDEEDDEDESGMNLDESFLREYNNVVRKGKDYTAGSPGEESSVHKKSAIATGGPGISTKANAKNIAQNSSGEGKMDGEKTNMGPTAKSLAGGVKGKFTDGSTLNVDGKQTKGYDKSTKKPSKEKNVNGRDVLPN